jgi:hypothetical protein
MPVADGIVNGVEEQKNADDKYAAAAKPEGTSGEVKKPKSRRRRRIEKDTRNIVIAVILGGLIVLVPNTINSYIQYRYAARQRLIERRVDSIKQFSLVCHRMTTLSQRAAMVYELLQHAKDTNNAGDTSQRFYTELTDVIRESNETWLNLQAERDMANALFGSSIPQLPPVTRIREPSRLEPEKQSRVLMFEMISVEGGMTKKCQDIIDFFTAKIYD